MQTRDASDAKTRDCIELQHADNTLRETPARSHALSSIVDFPFSQPITSKAARIPLRDKFIFMENLYCTL
jgi:hypothetical protein